MTLIYGTRVAHLLYADDLVLLATTAEGLQSQIQNLYNYCKKWHLIVSMTKTNVMVFNVKKRQNSSTFFYNNEVVEVVDSYKYLGFLICSNHKDIFHEVYQQLASKRAEDFIPSLDLLSIPHWPTMSKLST